MSSTTVRVFAEATPAQLDAARAGLGDLKPAPMAVAATSDGHGASVIEATYDGTLDESTQNRLRAALLIAVVGSTTPRTGVYPRLDALLAAAASAAQDLTALAAQLVAIEARLDRIEAALPGKIKG